MNISVQLFQAWKNGDEDAIRTIWELLWDRLYIYAIKRCGGDKEQASDAFNDAFLEINERIARPDFFEWKGEKEFYKFVRTRIGWRCVQIQREQNSRIMISLFKYLCGEEDEELINVLIDKTPIAENKIIAKEDAACFEARFWNIYETLPEALKAVIEVGITVIKESEEEGEDLKRKDILARIQDRLRITKRALDLRNKRLRKFFTSSNLSCT